MKDVHGSGHYLIACTLICLEGLTKTVENIVRVVGGALTDTRTEYLPNTNIEGYLCAQPLATCLRTELVCVCECVSRPQFKHQWTDIEETVYNVCYASSSQFLISYKRL
jgi:hypothetical protein